MVSKAEDRNAVILTTQTQHRNFTVVCYSLYDMSEEYVNFWTMWISSVSYDNPTLFEAPVVRLKF